MFIPRGEQTATNLVRGLLAGPGRPLDEISRSALPSRTALDLSVVVTESGVAEVPFPTVVTAMVGVHGVIGIGEAAITALAVSSIVAVRPDLVYGARRSLRERPLTIREEVPA